MFRHFALLNYNNRITLKIWDMFPDRGSSKRSGSFPEVQVCPTKAFSPFPRYTELSFSVNHFANLWNVSRFKYSRRVSCREIVSYPSGWTGNVENCFRLKEEKWNPLALHRASSFLHDNFHLEGFNRSFILICMRTSRCHCLYVNHASSYRHRGADPTP